MTREKNQAKQILAQALALALSANGVSFTEPLAPRKLYANWTFPLSPTLQAPMEDGKRETAVSMLPIVPEDSDTGRTYTCRVLNLAAPAGRQISVTINVQRECFLAIGRALSSAVWAHLVQVDSEKVKSGNKVAKVLLAAFQRDLFPVYRDRVAPQAIHGSLEMVVLSDTQITVLIYHFLRLVRVQVTSVSLRSFQI